MVGIAAADGSRQTVTAALDASTTSSIATLGVMAATVVAGSRPSHRRPSAALLFLMDGAATATPIGGTY